MDTGRDRKTLPLSGKKLLRKLIPNLDGYTKFGLVVEEGWPMWGISIIDLGYHVVCIYSPTRFRRFLQVGTLVRSEWIPQNQVGELRNFCYIWVFVSEKADFVRQV